MIVRPASEPCFILGVLGGVVVHDDMDSEPLRDLTIAALVAFADDKPPKATSSAAKTVIVPRRT